MRDRNNLNFIASRNRNNKKSNSTATDLTDWHCLTVASLIAVGIRVAQIGVRGTAIH